MTWLLSALSGLPLKVWEWLIAAVVIVCLALMVGSLWHVVGAQRAAYARLKADDAAALKAEQQRLADLMKSYADTAAKAAADTRQREQDAHDGQERIQAALRNDRDGFATALADAQRRLRIAAADAARRRQEGATAGCAFGSDDGSYIRLPVGNASAALALAARANGVVAQLRACQQVILNDRAVINR